MIMNFGRKYLGYEGLYQVSNLGRIKRLSRTAENKGTYSGKYVYKEKILTPRKNINRAGYYEISLYKNGKEKRHKLHRLVAETFIKNPYNKPQINHISGNKDDNSIYNLEWVTDKENKEHAWENELYNANHKKKPIKCNESGIIYESVAEASRKLKCDRRGIFRVLKREKQSIKRMTFSYLDKKELEAYKNINKGE